MRVKSDGQQIFALSTIDCHVAFTTKGVTVVEVVSEMFVLNKSIKVMRVEFASVFSAFSAIPMIAFEHFLLPVTILHSGAGESKFISSPAEPSWIVGWICLLMGFVAGMATEAAIHGRQVFKLLVAPLTFASTPSVIRMLFSDPVGCHARLRAKICVLLARFTDAVKLVSAIVACHDMTSAVLECGDARRVLLYPKIETISGAKPFRAFVLFQLSGCALEGFAAIVASKGNTATAIAGVIMPAFTALL